MVDKLFDLNDKKPPNRIQNACFIDAAVYEQLKLINTGEAAISFFAKYGNTTPIKFIYCIRKKYEDRSNINTDEDEL